MSALEFSNDEMMARLANLPEPDLTDPDVPEWTEADVAGAVRVENLPADELDLILKSFPKTAARLGRESSAETPLVTLDADIVAYFKATGAGWQDRINDLLRERMQQALAVELAKAS